MLELRLGAFHMWPGEFGMPSVLLIRWSQKQVSLNTRCVQNRDIYIYIVYISRIYIYNSLHIETLTRSVLNLLHGVESVVQV